LKLQNKSRVVNNLISILNLKITRAKAVMRVHNRKLLPIFLQQIDLSTTLGYA
jgi:hypothetical protein